MTAKPNIKRADWIVADVSMSRAQALVEAHHYARGASKQRAFIHGMFPAGLKGWDAACVGVAWWIPPTTKAARSLCPENWRGVLALSRLALEPEAPRKSASYLVRQSVALIDPDRWPVLVTYADTWRGHRGAFYISAGFKFDGETRPTPTWTIDGRLVSQKTDRKTRTREEMLALGAVFHGNHPKLRYVLRRPSVTSSPTLP